MKKNVFLYSGGFDKTFNKIQDAEDDLIFRLLAMNTKILLPADFFYTSTESKYISHKYVGWKALWTLHGDFLYEKGFLAYKLFQNKKEEEVKDSSLVKFNLRDKKSRIINREYYKFLEPKTDKLTETKNFIYGRNPYIMNYAVFDALGGFQILEETWTNADCMEIIKKSSPESKIIFWNPYGSEKSRKLFQILKQNGYQTFVVERGALPNSIVFDPDDLCVYSNSYNRVLWDYSLTEEDYKRASNYIDNLKNNDATLEANSERLPLHLLRTKFQTNKFKKIILVCFQLYDDSVTNTEYKISYPYFIEQIHEFSKNLPDDYLLLYKNHPLSNFKNYINNAICVDDYHIHDLLELTDEVIVYNSGVGVLAQAFMKHVYIFGPAFYADSYFNNKVISWEELLKDLKNSKHIIDEEKVIRFYSYLINNLYSFGFASEPFLSRRYFSTSRYFKHFAYNSLKIGGSDRWSSKCDSLFIPEKSILFKRFYSFLEQKKKPQVMPATSSVKALINLYSDYDKIKSKKETVDKNQIIKKKIKKFVRSPYRFFHDFFTR